MLCIRFDPHEAPAPWPGLLAGHQGSVAVADWHGYTHRVIFFGHGLECPACRGLLQGFVAQQSELRGLDAQVLAILPSHAAALESGLAGVAVLADPADLLRRRYAELIEFDTARDVLLFVLDRYGVPYAAWAGQEAGAPDHLVPETLKWLEFIAIQCPE